MELNILRLRLVGVLSFGIFLILCILSWNTPENTPAGRWGSDAERVMITVSVCSFIGIFAIRIWDRVKIGYLKKEDSDSETEW